MSRNNYSRKRGEIKNENLIKPKLIPGQTSTQRRHVKMLAVWQLKIFISRTCGPLLKQRVEICLGVEERKKKQQKLTVQSQLHVFLLCNRRSERRCVVARVRWRGWREGTWLPTERCSRWNAGVNLNVI